MAEASKKRLEWSRPARTAYEATIARVFTDDIYAASLVERRVVRSIALLQTFPQLGVPGALVGTRSYPILNTGHSVTYRVTPEAILILRWYRQRQNVPR